MYGITFIVLAVAACVSAGPTSNFYKNNHWQESTRMSNGNDASRYQFPYQVSVQKHNLHWCGGTLINTKWVLTAAHCDMVNLDEYRVVAGLVHLDEQHPDNQIAKVLRYIPYPGYDEQTSLKYDIALLELSSPMVLGKAVQLARLPTEAESNVIRPALLSGWGLTQTHEVPNTLQWLEMPRVAHQDCERIMIELKGTIGEFNVDMICTIPNDGAKESACVGDSGGPLVEYFNDEPVVVGVVSWGFHPCGGSDRDPSVFTKVSSYLSFIQHYVQLSDGM